MTRVFRLLLALIIVGLFLSPTQGRPDFGPLYLAAFGGGAAPKGPHETIRMESQEVTIRLRKNSYLVDAVFHFFNTGEKTTEWVGFPKGERNAQFVRFDTWVDGNKRDVAEESALVQDAKSPPGKPEPSRQWLVQHVTFPGHAKTSMRVSYEADYRPTREFRRAPRKDDPPDWRTKLPSREAVYEYGTGSYWKDSIRLVAFTIDGTEIGGRERFSQSIWPPHHIVHGWAFKTENALRLVTTDLEPQPHDSLVVYLLNQ